MKLGFSLSIGTVVLGLAGVVSGQFGAVPARAAALIAPLLSGSSSNPILGVLNTGSGEAIDATAVSNYAIVGRTNFAKSTATVHYGGVGGIDASAGTARSYNTGVFGLSQNGNGILGSTAFNGWNLTNVFPTAGVYGGDLSTKTINGYSNESGVYGTSTYGNGVEGFAKGGTGVYGQTNNASTTVGFAAVQGNDGNTTSTSPNIGVYGYSANNFGMFGVSSNGVGINGVTLGSGFGVRAVSRGTGTALRLLTFAGGPLATATNGTKEVMSLDGSGNFVVAGTITQKGSPLIARRTSVGTTVVTRGVETTSATIEDAGEAQLVGGRAHVALPIDFARTIDARAPYLVFITPEGLSTGTLCVTARTAAGFTVTESNRGSSSIAFAYRIVARPLSEPATRLPAAAADIVTPPERPDPTIARARPQTMFAR